MLYTYLEHAGFFLLKKITDLQFLKKKGKASLDNLG